MEESNLARVFRSILYVLMKPISSNMLRTPCRHTRQISLFISPVCFFRLFSLLSSHNPLSLSLTWGVVSSGRERGVYVNSAKHGWISFTGSIPVTSSLVTSSSDTCSMCMRHDKTLKTLLAGHAEYCRWMFVYLHVVHHHFIGKRGPELSLMHFLVEQRLKNNNKKNKKKKHTDKHEAGSANKPMWWYTENPHYPAPLLNTDFPMIWYKTVKHSWSQLPHQYKACYPVKQQASANSIFAHLWMTNDSSWRQLFFQLHIFMECRYPIEYLQSTKGHILQALINTKANWVIWIKYFRAVISMNSWFPPS